MMHHLLQEVEHAVIDTVHPAAREGYARQADAYARGRPGYPQFLHQWLRDEVGIDSGSTVIEVGAGTGKFTSLLLATDADVVAIEPVAEMRAQLRRLLPAVRVMTGTAQALPLASASADAIVCAQSFHWFANREALDEFARVLKADGRLALVWNVRDERCDWVAELMRMATESAGSAPLLASKQWQQAFPHPAFGPLVQTEHDHVHEGPVEQVIVDHFLSISFVASLPPAERDQMRDRIRALIARHPALRGKTRVRFPYRTMAFVTQHKPR